MKNIYFLIGVLTLLLFRCTPEVNIDANNHLGNSQTLQKINLQLTSEDYVDSAQLLFFRPLAQSDTLVHQEIIYGIEFIKPHPFQFELPAGKYKVYIFGNVPTECIVLNPPYSTSDIYLNYADQRPTSIYYGINYMNVGVDTQISSAMLLLSSVVKLTITKVPTGIHKIFVNLLNTSSGIKLAGGFLEKPVDPPLADTINDVKADSSYLVEFPCLPGVGKVDNSTLEVNCLDETGQIIYTGESDPFSIRSGYYMVITCDFKGKTKGGKGTGKLNFKIRKE